MARRRRPQEYSAEEFDAVVDLLKTDEKARRNIEAITGKSLRGKTPREVFDLYLTVQKATEVKATFAAYGKAGVVLDEVRREVEGRNVVEAELEAAKNEIKDLETVNGSLKRALEAERVKTQNAIAAPAMAVHSEGTGR
ncbi:hypothetical protein [Actinomadura bangladeshensis]|uniref:Uncharacterized protein n=1 Tax=Actinomadura bangladeshensis TaxID=453573 RepID=A0A6L9Q838_9ACTN|nr:hypothetical protein [Actinomadura bangladeshensis]NEA21571.1 hypothetical protein [Actinomadura bangladeshensis]NEA22531.1 hypothetical protein [Actinomadura bangladeshensis]